MAAASRRHEIPLAILYSVGLTETGRGDGLRPYALNIAGNAVYDLDKSEAVNRFKAARRDGVKLIDVGCMQINFHYHKTHFSSVSEMLEPARNVDYAARFLKQLYNREGSWTMAVARYHAGPKNTIAQKRYVCSVIRNLVSSKFGRWTQRAKEFCSVSKVKSVAKNSDRGLTIELPWDVLVSRN